MRHIGTAPMDMQREQFGVQYLAKEDFRMQFGEATATSVWQLMPTKAPDLHKDI